MTHGCKTPCKECPFSRSTPAGQLGGADPTTFLAQASLPFWLPCHMDPGYEKDKRDPSLLQCGGAATFRANIGVAPIMPDRIHVLPKDTEKVFGSLAEFMSHHTGISLAACEQLLTRKYMRDIMTKELSKAGVLPMNPTT